MLHEIYSVTAFEVIAPYTLCIKFNDNSVRSIDFRPMLRGELFGPLLRLDFFNQVRLDRETGTLVWPNGADFDPATLHDWDKVGEAMITMARSWPEPLFDGSNEAKETATHEKKQHSTLRSLCGIDEPNHD